MKNAGVPSPSRRSSDHAQRGAWGAFSCVQPIRLSLIGLPSSRHSDSECAAPDHGSTPALGCRNATGIEFGRHGAVGRPCCCNCTNSASCCLAKASAADLRFSTVARILAAPAVPSFTPRSRASAKALRVRELISGLTAGAASVDGKSVAWVMALREGYSSGSDPGTITGTAPPAHEPATAQSCSRSDRAPSD